MTNQVLTVLIILLFVVGAVLVFGLLNRFRSKISEVEALAKQLQLGTRAYNALVLAMLANARYGTQSREAHGLEITETNDNDGKYSIFIRIEDEDCRGGFVEVLRFDIQVKTDYVCAIFCGVANGVHVDRLAQFQDLLTMSCSYVTNWPPVPRKSAA